MKSYFLPALLALAALPALAQTTTEVRPVPAFHALTVGTGIELTLTSGPTERVEASADTPENLGHLKTTVTDGVLSVRFEWLKGEGWRGDNHRRLRVAVTAAGLTGLAASSGASLRVSGPYPSPDLALEASSGANLKGEFTTTTMNARVSSGSELVVSGRTGRLEVRSSSGSSFQGRELQADACQASASSGASVTVGVKNTLSAEASSGGSVSYSGSPQVTKHVSSGGSVSQR